MRTDASYEYASSGVGLADKKRLRAPAPVGWGAPARMLLKAGHRRVAGDVGRGAPAGKYAAGKEVLFDEAELG